MKDCPHLRVYPKTPLCKTHHDLAMAYWGPQSKTLAKVGISIAPPTDGWGRRGSSQDLMLAEVERDTKEARRYLR